MIDYILNTEYTSGPVYSFSYIKLKEKYNEFINMDDQEFLNNINHATHFACMVSWIKERGQYAICDEGIVHELVHLMCDGTTTSLQNIRNQFKVELLLS